MINIIPPNKKEPFLVFIASFAIILGGCNWLGSAQPSSLSSPQDFVLQEVNSGADVTGITISPDGKTLVISKFRGPLELWDRQSSQKLRTFRPGSYDAQRSPTAYSPIDRMLASGDSKNQIGLWDIQSGRLKRTLVGHTKPVNAIAFSQDGEFLASGGIDGTVRLWNVQAGKLQRTFIMTHEVLQVGFTKDSSILNSADLAGTVQQWNTQTGKPLRTLSNPQNDVSVQGTFYPVSFSSDGRLMARGDFDRKIRLWNLQTGVMERTLAGHQEPAHAITFSSSSQVLATVGGSGQRELLTGGNLHNLRLWNTQTGTLLSQSGDKEYITSLIFDSDEKTLITGSSGKLLIWNVSQQKSQR